MPNYEESKVRAARLESGDEILVMKTREGLQLATVRRGSLAVVVLGIESVTAPTAGGRRGYAITTDRGTIDFVTGVAVVLRAGDNDWKRTRKAEREQGRDAVPVPEALNGVSITAQDRASAVKGTARPKVKAPRWSAPVPVPAPSPVPPVEVVGAGAVPARGPEAARNYRAQARAAVTDRARRFWTRKADEAGAP